MANSDKRINIKRILRFVPMLVIMGLIFYFSAMPAGDSDATSQGLLEMLLNAFENEEHILSEATRAILHELLRKTAHFTEFALLGVSAYFALADRKSKPRFWISLCIAVIYAASDEIHQLFVPGRFGIWSDVVIDSLGALTGILIYRRIARKKNTRMRVKTH